LKAAAFTASLALPLAPTAYGQRWSRPSPGDYYGTGAGGTIGRGTLILPGGPLDGQPPGQTGWDVPSVTYSGRYSWARAAAPYLTTRTYVPGDGYRYPLYYNPATAAYFYYPVPRR